jgi:hypothetical protein
MTPKKETFGIVMFLGFLLMIQGNEQLIHILIELRRTSLNMPSLKGKNSYISKDYSIFIEFVNLTGGGAPG